MDALSDLIRNLAIILLLVSFMEMLLPNKKLRGYVQLVMGLFIISALIHPISNILSMPLEMAVPAWNSTIQEDLPVLADDRRHAGNPIHEQFRLILSNQIRALALGVEGVKDARVEIELDALKEDVLSQPQVSRVNIYLTESTLSIPQIEPIIIGEDPGGELIEDQNHHNHPVAEKVRERVVSLMQIPGDKIHIHIDS